MIGVEAAHEDFVSQLGYLGVEILVFELPILSLVLSFQLVDWFCTSPTKIRFILFLTVPLTFFLSATTGRRPLLLGAP